MFKRLWKYVDLYLLVPALLLTFLSFFVLSSFQPELARAQAVYTFFGVVIYLILSKIHPDILRGYAFHIYLFVLILLAAVFLIGEISHGANRWLPIWGDLRLQPSEFAKPALILLFAKIFAASGYQKFNNFLLVFFCGALYFILVFHQPDLGTALMFIVLIGVYIYLSNYSLKTVGVAIAVLAGITIIAAPVSWNYLHDYQRNRILNFINPERDPLGSGYNVLQSIITVGSGGVYGKGFGRGTQSHNNFLPEQYTDFAFATYSEEFGFVGIGLLLLLYGAMLSRIVILINSLNNRFGVYICSAVIFLIAFQLFVNMGMNMGIVPVTGITLPFFSYGGSSIISFLICLGLVQSASKVRISSNF